MRKPLSIILTLAIVVTMVFGSATSVFAAESTVATTMKIAGTDGTVTITTDKGKDIAAKVDTKLLNGYTIKTAAASYCFISLDDSKAIKLGQNTKVKVEKSGKKIELNVKNGEIYFDVDKKLSGNESMNIKTGNMTTGIRGTSGTLKTIKQGQNTIDLFQLFSGKTEMKANTQQGVQNIIERILGVLGIGSQTQTVTPVNSGNANAQPLESTMASAGQQIAITGADSAASTGPQNVPTFERQALAVSEFGTRSILESAAIKGGMSAGEALAAGTEQIVEQVGDLTQTLENAGVAQAAVDKIAEAAADPQTLDAQIAGAEQQAVQQTQQAEQTIEGAKEEAAKVEGTTTNTTENKVLENVEVKTDSGANASGLTLSDDGTSTAAPAGQTKPSSGSGSGGGSQQEAWLTGYTGTYDGQGHAIATNLSARLADYDIWIFDNDESFNSFNTFYTRVKSEYAEVSKSMAGTADGAPAFGDYLRGTWGTDLDNYSENLASADNQHNVKNVSDSGAYKYFALGKAAPFDEKQGTITVKLEPQELVVKWFLADIRSGVEFGRTANITASSIGDISNNRPVPVAGIIGENGRFEQITCRATIGSDPTDIELAAIYTSDNPTAFDTTYNATVTGIDVVLYHHSDRPVETDALQASNYKLPESGLTISFSYHMPPQPVGSVVTDQDFFSAANRATWGDYTTYDLAFVAESDGNESTYTKYARVNGAGTQSVVTTGVEVSEVLAALGSDSNLYNTILWDTGRTAQYISPDVLSANSTMTATASNRAIYISGAGIDCGYTTEGRVNITSGGKLLVVKIGDNAGLTASDDGTRFKVPNLTVGANTYVTNNGTATIMQNMTVEGDFNNYRNLIINETSTDRIYVRGGTLTQERGVIWDKRQTTVDSNTPNPTYPMFSLSGGGNVNLYGGSLKHDLNLAESYSLPADNIKTLVYATLGNHMTMKAMDDGKAFTYTAPDGTQARAYKFYYTATGGNNIAGSFLNNGVTTLSTATDTITGGNTTTHKNIWATGLNTRYVAESYPDAAYAEITFPIAGSDASFTEYVAPTGLNVTDGVFDESNRANWSDYTKYDVALLAGEVNSNGIREYQLYRHGEFDNEPIGFDTVSDWLKDDTYSSIYWEPTPADAAELYNPLNVAAGHNPVFDGNLEIAATTTNKAVFISGPGIATAGYTTLSAVGSNKLFVRVGDGSAAAAGTSQTAIESANISVGSGVELINSGRLDVRDITLAASSKLANTGRLNCSSGGFAIDGSALFTNESIGAINIDSYGPYVAMTGTGTLTNNGAMNLNAAFHINSGTTLLNRGYIEIPEQNTSAASSAMIRVVGGTFTQEVPSGKATEDVYVRDSRTVAYDATGALQGSSYGSMILLDSSGVVNLNGGRIEKSMNNAVSADNGQLRLTTITRAIFGNSINIYNYSYTPAGGSALPALKASQGDSCAINGTLLSGSDAATTSDYFYVTGSNSGGPVGQVGINYISFPAPAGTYEVATNPTGLVVEDGVFAGENEENWSDFSKYAVAFIAEGEHGGADTYTKYELGTQVGTEVELDDVLAALSGTTYSSIYWDTGWDHDSDGTDYFRKCIELETVSVLAHDDNKAVFISGAGIELSREIATLAFESVGDGKLYVMTDNSGARCFDDDAERYEPGRYSILAPSIVIGSNVEFTNNFGYISADDLTVTEGGILYNNDWINVGMSDLMVGGANSVLSNNGRIEISDDSNGGIRITSDGMMNQYANGIIWDRRDVRCNFESSAIVGITADNGGLISIEEGAEVNLYGGELRRSIATDTDLNEIEDDGDLIEAIVKIMFRAGEIDPIEIVDRNFMYTPETAAPELPRAVLCRMDEGSGNIHGSVMVDDEPVLNDNLDSDIFTGDTSLANTFWATYNSADFVTNNGRYVYLSFPIPAGTFQEQV